MVRWVVGSILHEVDPLSYFSFQPVSLDWCNKVRGMCYPACGMVHIKEPLLLIGKSSGSGFPLYYLYVKIWLCIMCCTYSIHLSLTHTHTHSLSLLSLVCCGLCNYACVRVYVYVHACVCFFIHNLGIIRIQYWASQFNPRCEPLAVLG